MDPEVGRRCQIHDHLELYITFNPEFSMRHVHGE